MARKIRRIDDAGEIKDWVEAMASINRLLKELDIKSYKDEWRPWRLQGMKGKQSYPNGHEDGGLKKDLNDRLLNDNEADETTLETRVPKAMEMEVEDGQMKKEKVLKMLMPNLRSPFSQGIMRGNWGIKGMGVKKDTAKKETVKVAAQIPLTGNMTVPHDVGTNSWETEDDGPALTNDQIRKLWGDELHRRMREKGYNCGVEWSLSREWNTGRTLLKSIAEAINRDGTKDLGRKDLNLKTFLDNESNMYFKTGKYLDAT